MKKLSPAIRRYFGLGFVVAVVLLALPLQSAFALGGGSGSISLTALGSAYTQDFDALSNTGTLNNLTINGWFLNEVGTSASNNGQYSAGTGSGTSGDVYSFGASAAAERAFGTLLSGTLAPTIGAQFTNNTGSTVTSLDISYLGEMWRLGQVTAGRAADRLDFQFSTDATSLTTGAWTDSNGLDFSSPVLTGAAATALDGNAPGNQTAVSSSITGLSILNGASFWIRWTDPDLIPGADDGLSVDNFSVTPVGASPATTLSINDVSKSEGNAGTTTFTFTVSLSAAAGAAGVSFDIETADGTAVAPGDFTAKPPTRQTISAGNTTATFDVLVKGDMSAEPDETFLIKVTNTTGATVADGEGQGTIVNDDCGDPYTRIYTIQGSGAATPIPGTVSTEGVVVGDFEGTAAASGFYIQDPTGDGSTATADGIFVFTGNASTPNVGDRVRVTGFARERFNQTTLNGSNSDSAAVPAANILTCSTGNSIAPTNVSLPFASATAPEQFEGMLVRFPQPLVIAEYFNYDQFGEIVLANPLAGEPRPFSGTALDEPGAPANARTLANSLNRITLDDAQSGQNPGVLRHPNGLPFTLGNLFRGGDLVTSTVGVLGFDFNLYRVYPTAGAQHTVVNPRPAAPEPVGGRTRVAAMNTLNFFLTLDYPTGNPLDNKCGPLQTLECRGADFVESTEFTRQRDKLLAALAGLNGDVVGLNEIENTPGVQPLGDPTNGVVAGLNAISGPGTYSFIDTGVLGTDAIRVGLIYKPAKVTPIGSFAVLTSAVDPRFIDTRSRPALAQTFAENATGARFTVVVNHLKSKGSACAGDPDAGDGQGNCSGTRTLAAQALVDWLATDPTSSGDPDFLIAGDLNSYAKEDPIDAIKAGSDDTAGTGDDYTNLISVFQGPFAYSYTFDGQAGYLDHSLANSSLVGQVTGAADWHINSDEPDVVDYDTSFKPAGQEALYEPNASRSSDHDPVVVGLDLTLDYAGLCELTKRLVTKTSVEKFLCKKLEQAEKEVAKGHTKQHDKKLADYRKRLDKETGKSVSAADAALLKKLSLAL